MQYEHLSHRGILSLSGEDAIAFLQGIISGNAERLSKGEAIYAALLSPQGKFLHDLFLVMQDGKILIDCERERMDDLRKRLMLYKLRSKVTIEATDYQVVAVWGGNPGQGFADPRLRELGYRIIGTAKEINATQGDYDAMRLALGVPDGSRDLIIDKSILLELGFEDLHGVDFIKGCYVGQEVTARSKYRGQLKKYIHHVKAVGVLPAAGTPITAAGVAIGELRSSKNTTGLAIVRVEELAKAKENNQPIKAGDVDVTLSLPQWFTPPSQ